MPHEHFAQDKETFLQPPILHGLRLPPTTYRSCASLTGFRLSFRFEEYGRGADTGQTLP